MRKLIEYTLISADGVYESPPSWGALDFRDDGYLRDGLGVLTSCDAMLMGRNMYEGSARIWPARSDPWAMRLNAMRKIVFSSTLKQAEWNNSTVVRGDAVEEVARLKQEQGGNLLIWGRTQLARALAASGLVDLLDLSIHPVIVGRGKVFFQEGVSANLKLVATKSFSKIVKLTFEHHPG
jgi:dihydrofolate reductase